MAEAGLRRAIGLRTVVSSGAGLAFAATSFPAVMEVGRGLPGATAWLPIALAGLLSMLVAWVFSELVGMYPTAAGIKLYIEKAFGERAALVVGALYVLVSVGIAATDTYVLAGVLGPALPQLPGWVWVVGIISLITLVNLRGIRLSGLTQDITTYTQYAILLGLSLWAVIQPPGDFPQLLPTAGGHGLGMVQATALAIFLFMGWEWVMPLAEEVTDVRLIGRGMVWAVGLLTVTYVLMHVGMIAAVPKVVLMTSPAPHLLLAQAMLGKAGTVLMLFTTLIATLTTFNAGILTASRFLYAMARDHALPQGVARLHPRHATPWVATLVLSGIALAAGLVVLWTRQFQVLIMLGAALECLVYAVMAAALVRLRRTEPDRVRPFRMPGVPWLGRAVVIIFAGLLVLVFWPQPERLASQLWALGVGAAAAALIGLYVWQIVPRLRAKYAAQAAQRQRRRPGR